MQHTTQQKMSQGRQERHGDAIGSFIIDKSALSDDVGKYWITLGCAPAAQERNWWWQVATGVSSSNCWTVPRHRESKNPLSANCNDPTTDDYALSTQLLSDFRWGASSMRHNPPLWQEQLLMELLSDLRSQGGIISAFIKTECWWNAWRNNGGGGGGWRFNQAGGGRGKKYTWTLRPSSSSNHYNFIIVLPQNLLLTAEEPEESAMASCLVGNIWDAYFPK